MISRLKKIGCILQQTTVRLMKELAIFWIYLLGVAILGIKLINVDMKMILLDYFSSNLIYVGPLKIK